MKSIVKNLSLYVVSSALAGGVIAGYAWLGSIALENHQRRWPSESQPTVVMREVCYDKNTSEEVRLTPLDYQQINSRAGRNFDGLWSDLECKLVERE